MPFPEGRRKYHIRTVEPDPGVDYLIVEITPDPKTDYKIGIYDPETKQETSHLHPEDRSSLSRYRSFVYTITILNISASQA